MTDGAKGAPSAEVVARAVVAAGMLLGVDPARAFEPTVRAGRKAGEKGPATLRALAGHGLRARLGTPAPVLGRIFGMNPVAFAPSQRERYGITTDQLLVIAEAIGGDEARPARARFLEPWSGAPAADCPAAPQPRSPAAPQPRSPAAPQCGWRAAA